jgi:hypothetical protein
MTAPESSTPGNRPRRQPGDPLQMSLAEKLACEWEARHDVAARGRIADMAPVQHYLTHTRCEDHRHPAAARAPRPHANARPTGSVPSGLSGWLRWGDDGTSPSGSVLPRGC